MRGSLLVMILYSIGIPFLAGRAEAQPSAILPALSDSQTASAEHPSFVMPAPSLWDLISNPSVQADLELVDDQKKQVEQLSLQMARESRQLFAETQGAQDYDLFADQISVMKRKYIKRLDDVLLPLQVDRMKQIALQMHLKRSGMANAITSPAVAELLELSDQQVDQLKKKSLSLKKKLAIDIQQLKTKRDQALLNELTPLQRTKLTKLLGNKWAPKPEDWSKQLEQIRQRQAENQP